jgi:outer membrane protein assembly factor BamD (BamD/ComL family)
MIAIGLDSRGLVFAALVIALTTVSLRLQEQKFRQRQVYDPQTGEWTAEEVTVEEAAGDELAQARVLLAESKPTQARPLLKRWLKANPEDERVNEATFLLGETYFEARDFWQAANQYTTVAENASGELFDLANQRCVDVARAFLSGQKRIVWGFLRLPAYAEAVELLDRVWERVPGTRLGELALKLKADYYAGNGDLDLAQDEYANLAQQYPSGRYVQFAMLRAAECAEGAFPGIKFDDRPLLEADERYRQVLTAFPIYGEREQIAERLEGIREQRAEKDLDIGGWYERTRQPSAAEFYYRQILKDWPNTLAATHAQTRLRAMGAPLEETLEEGSAP